MTSTSLADRDLIAADEIRRILISFQAEPRDAERVKGVPVEKLRDEFNVTAYYLTTRLNRADTDRTSLNFNLGMCRAKPFAARESVYAVERVRRLAERCTSDDLDSLLLSSRRLVKARDEVARFEAATAVGWQQFSDLILNNARPDASKNMGDRGYTVVDLGIRTPPVVGILSAWTNGVTMPAVLLIPSSMPPDWIPPTNISERNPNLTVIRSLRDNKDFAKEIHHIADLCPWKLVEAIAPRVGSEISAADWDVQDNSVDAIAAAARPRSFRMDDGLGF